MMTFEINDYLANGVAFPRHYHSIYSIDKAKYSELERKYDKHGDTVSVTFEKIKKRTSGDYYAHVLKAQSDALDYSQYLFPTYKFILPETLMDDWMAVMDPHREGKRDHSLHQPMSAYIVSKLLGRGVPSNSLSIKGTSLLDKCADLLMDENNADIKYLRDYFSELYPSVDKMRLPESIKKHIARDVFYQTAVTSALFHDIGYPWQFANSIDKALDASEYEAKGNLLRSVNGISDMIAGRLLVNPFYGYSSSSKKNGSSTWKRELSKNLADAFYGTHGFPGALAFTYLTDQVRVFPKELNFNEAVCQFITDWAAVGILMHDMPNQYWGGGKLPSRPQYRLHADVDPLSCLIALSDVLEEFNRPLAKFTPNPTSVDVEYNFACNETDIDVLGDKLIITYHYKTPTGAAANKKRRLDEIEAYFGVRYGYIDLSALGIKNVECKVV